MTARQPADLPDWEAGLRGWVARLNTLRSETGFISGPRVMACTPADAMRGALAEIERLRADDPMAEHFLDANERMAEALTAIGMALGLPRPGVDATWGAPEILTRIEEVRSALNVDDGDLAVAASFIREVADETSRQLAAWSRKSGEQYDQINAVLAYLDGCDNGMGSVQGSEVRALLGTTTEATDAQ